jgi:hypothetical protein
MRWWARSANKVAPGLKTVFHLRLLDSLTKQISPCKIENVYHLSLPRDISSA